VTGGFKDHFSTLSDGYARYRPTYPAELFQFLASVASAKTVAWDCATGSGQVAVALAIWCYELCAVNAECDTVVDRLYRGILDGYWTPERMLVEQGYSGVAMPGMPVPAPELAMSLEWHVADMLGYLRSWSACKRYEIQVGSDPVAEISAELRSVWGDGVRRVAWPLAIKASRPNTLLE